jgi:hypothetical protein
MGVSATAQNGWHVIKLGEPTITIIGAPGLTRERLDAMVLIVRGARQHSGTGATDGP